MAAALPFIAAAATVISAVGQIAQGNAQASAYQYNQQFAEAQGRIQQQQAEAQAALDKQNSDRLKGEIITTYGVAGIDPGTGTPLDVLSDAAAQAELTRQTTLYRGTLARLGDLADAQLSGIYASNAATGGYIRAGSTILTGAGDVIQNWPGSGPTVPAPKIYQTGGGAVLPATW